MNFDKRWHLKWLNPNDAALKGKNFRIINQCALVSASTSKGVVGLTVFEPREFNADFMRRLRNRLSTLNQSHYKNVLYLPPFLRHRSQGLILHNDQVEVVYSPFLFMHFDGENTLVREKIRAVSVDDSPVLLKFIKQVMDDLECFEIVAQISDPRLAVEQIRKLKPDVVTMDIQMPGKTGVEVVSELLAKEEFPVLMISSLGLEEGSQVFDALNAGAFDYIQKPSLENREDFKEELLLKCLMAMGGGHLVRKIQKPSQSVGPVRQAQLSKSNDLIWCLGSSTGGTQALTRIFTSLPREIPATLIVQHMPPVFSKSFANSLSALCPFPVKEAEDGEVVKANHVYIAPGGYQMGVEGKVGQLKIKISDAEPVNRFKPSVDYLFQSVAKVPGLRVVAGLLTGMGKDGAQGLLELQKKGASTLAQDEQSCAVFGMPRAAIEIGAASAQVHIDQFANALLENSMTAKKAC